MSAIGADQQAGKHIAFPFVGTALADLAALLLDLLKDRPLNDRFVDVLKDNPVLPVIFNSLFVLVRLGVGFEIKDVAAILLQRQYFGNTGAVPLCRSLLLSFAGPFNAFFEPVGAGRQDTVLFKTCCNLLCSITIQGHTINPTNHLGGLLIHDPPFGIVRVLDIAVGRLPHRLARIALDLIADPALLADVTGVPLIEDGLFGKGIGKYEKT